MYYVYILKHPTEDEIYIGFTKDLRSRMKDHQSIHRDWKLAYYEAYASETDVRARERRWKHHGNVKQLPKKADHAEPGDGLK
jgi:predicted GIY-YIG superfamily endonuclease